jgi:pimeloyl-ACP methyl ester carboxylesterase
MAIGGYGLEGSPMTNSSEAGGAPGPGGEVRAPVIDPSAEPAGPATQAGPPRRRRRLALLATTAAAVALLLVVANTGAGWYFSGQVLHIDTASYPVTVRSVAGDTVTLSRDSDTVRPIRYGLTWPGGHAVLDDSVRVNGDSVVRTVTGLSRGALTAGLHAYMDAYVFATDPTAGRGLAFTTVTVHDELGDLPAWYIPPTATTARSTWVIAVHGRGATREETLRILPTLAGLGLPTLAITYRNDVDAPAGPDHFYHLGDTEWREVAAAIGYAQGQGATSVILYGWSMGGALVMTSLRRLPAQQAALVHGAVLDSPVMDWNATLALQARQRHLPGFLTWTAERLVERRARLSLGEFDQLDYAPRLTVPVLMFVDLSDTMVPPGPSLRFARTRPDLVTLVTTSGGNHTGSWNVDPNRYQSAVRDYFAAHG